MTRPTARPFGVSRRSALSIREQEPILGSRGEHAVGLEAPLGDQVVHKDADVGFLPPEGHTRFPPYQSRGVQPADESLSRRLLVSGGAVDLPGEKEPGEPFGLEGALELGRLDEVVLDRISGPEHHGFGQTGQFMDNRLLNQAGQADRKAVDVDLPRLDPFRLQKYLVALAIRESHHLVFERRADRADPADLAIEQREAARFSLPGGGHHPWCASNSRVFAAAAPTLSGRRRAQRVCPQARARRHQT